MAISEKLIDKRVVARNIKKGVIGSDDYQQFLSDLPDREDNVYKPEEVEEEEASTIQPDDAPSEIQATEPMAVQASSPETHEPSIESPAISVQEQPEPAQQSQPEPSSNQPEPQPDPDKPPFGQE